MKSSSVSTAGVLTGRGDPFRRSPDLRRSPRRMLTGFAAMAMLLGVLSASTDAGAVVPGPNGRILFARALLPCTAGCTWELVAADPNDTNETVLAGPFPRSSWPT